MELRRTLNTVQNSMARSIRFTGTYADTVSVKRIDANTIQSTLRKKDGQLMLIVITTVSADGKTRTSTFKGTDGLGHNINNIVLYDKR